jgi:hypothetical protein
MNKKIKIIVFSLFLFVFATKANAQISIPIIISEFGIEIRDIPRIGDTVYYKKSNKEKFRLVFYDKMGKCFIEHYINNRLSEKGNFGNSLDTLKRYVSSRDMDGNQSEIRVQAFFQPIKDGDWVILQGDKMIHEKYSKGRKIRIASN